MLAREVDGTDFRLSRSGDGADPVAAHSMRACRGAMVRRRRLYAYLGYPVITRLARMMVWLVDVTDFRPSRSGGGTEPVAAHSLRECRGAMVRRGRLYAYLGFPVAPRLARMLAWEVDGTDFRPSRNGDGAHSVAAHSLRACRGAIVRRRRLNAYLGYPVTPRLACMLAREVVGTDFRLSRSGDETEPVAAHSLRACRGAMVRRRRLYAYLGYPVAPMHVGMGWM